MEDKDKQQQCDVTENKDKNASCGCGSSSEKPCPCTKIPIIALVIIAVLAVIYFKGGSCPLVSGGSSASEANQAAVSVSGTLSKAVELKIPAMLEFGAGYCSACKAMKPVIAGLQKDFSGQVMVVPVDVNSESDITGKYSIKVIPTQIFLNAEGREIFRHEGFISCDDILAKWKTLGFEFKNQPDADK